MIEIPLFCGIRKSFNNKVDAAILSFETSPFYLEYFDDSDGGFEEFKRKLQFIRSGLRNHSSAIGVSALSRFSSDELNDFIFSSGNQPFEFHNKLINILFLHVDFELDGNVKNAAVPLAALTASAFLSKEFLNTKFYTSY